MGKKAISLVFVLLLPVLGLQTGVNLASIPDSKAHNVAMSNQHELSLSPISVGREHACAVLSDGGVSCWGYNDYGLLGIGIIPTNEERDIEGVGYVKKPTNVTGLPTNDPIIQVVVGGQTTCALASSGGVYCWGRGSWVGDSTLEDRSAPVDLGLSVGVSKLASSWIHTCALTVDGRVLCWGTAVAGLGDGVDRWSGAEAITPNFTGAFPEGRHAIDLAVATHGACALLDNGSVSCWDDNDTPREGFVFGPDIKATALHSDPWYADSGTGRVCATLDNNSMPCWYPSGYGTPDWIEPAPKDITIGPDHACILDENGAMACRGSNIFGQLGDGTIEDKTGFTPVKGLPNNETVVAMSTGERNTCAVVASGDAFCWGWNNGLNGDGTASGSYEKPVRFDLHPELQNITTIDGSGGTYCAIHLEGALGCWGQNNHGLIGDGTSDPLWDEIHLLDDSTFGGDVEKITFSFNKACALIADGSLWCWGTDSYDGASTPVKVPQFGPNRVIVDVALYSGGTCVVESTGHVSCWGEGGFGSIGNGAYEDKQNPTRTNSFGPALKATSIEASGLSICAHTETRTIWCWGSNFNGELGVGSDNYRENSPQEVLFSTDDVTVDDHASSIENHCVLLSNKSVYCWGANLQGGLGQGNGDQNSNVPILVIDETMQVSSLEGGWSTCVLLVNSSMWCWGDNTILWGAPVDAPTQRWEQPWLSGPNTHLSMPLEMVACVLGPEDGLWCLGDHTFVDYDSNRTIIRPVEDFGDGRTVLVPVFDTDEDGVQDHLDNCPDVSNPEQENLDSDAQGDACDDDDDGDGIMDANDVCPRLSDPQQTDTDGDDLGDMCDEDDDADGVLDDDDSCPLHHSIRDTNCNGVLDADEDQDGDGVLDDMDRCEGYPDSEDSDGDGLPDGCDDSDGDSVSDAEDICPDGDDTVDENQNDVPDACEDIPEIPDEITNETKSENNTLADGDDEGIVPSNDTGSGDMSSTVQIDVILASSLGLVVSVVLVVAVLRRRASAAVEPLPELDHEVEAYVAMLIAHGYAESEARPYAVAYYQQLRNP